MPTIQNTTRGQVVQIWGKAYIRGTDGVWRPLAVGEVVPQGAEILTEQDAIVMMMRGDVAVPKVAAESPVERAITAVDKGEEAPAAGLQGGGSGDLQPGLRVDRIVELVTPATIDTRLDSTAVEFGRATQSDPGASATGAPELVVGSSSITSVEAGGSVGLGLRAPSGSGTLTITVTQLPTIGQVVTADGTPVALGAVLTVEQLTGLIYLPPADYSAGTPVGTFGYSVSNGIETADGGTRIAVTPVNDLPVAIDGSNNGGEDMLLDVSLNGSDIDGTIARVTVRTLPANGTLLLADTLAPVTAGQVLTPAQAASLVFRPAANWNGSTAFTFTVTDNEGGVSAPATVRLTVTPANDPPAAVNDTSSTVAQAPVTVAVLANDSDIDNDPLTVSSASVPAAQGTVVVNADGTLTFTAADGVTGPVVISYSISDGNGGTASATLTVNVAATPTVTVDAPALTNDRTPTLTGSSNLPPGSTVTLTVTDALGAVQTFTTTVRADGTYSVDVPSNLAEGPYTAVANVSGPGGTSATANDNGVVDVTPPVITVDAPALTNDSTPALTGTTDLPVGSTITLAVTGANGVTQLFTTTVQAGGVFAVDVPAALVSGPFSVSARGTDAAGNTATATDNGVVDTVAPTITVDAPALTNDTTPPLTGTTDLPAGSTVTLTVTGANGAVQTFTTTVQTGGTFSVSVPAALVEGNFSVSASGTDAAGNTATASDNGVIDITAPTVTVDAPALTNDTTPALTGTTNLPVGATVTLTVTGANGAVQTFTATVRTGGVFSVDVPAALVQGTFNVVATATDAAGNSATASDAGVIDTTPPIASLTIDPVTADNIVNAGEATGTITLTGTVGGDVRVGDTVTLNVNGVNYTGLVLAGNTFAISVPGSAVLADADRRIDGSVTTTDNAGNSATATAQRPYAVNTAPIAVNDTLSIGEDTPSASGDVTPGTTAQDRDADGDTLTVIGVATGVQPSAAGNVNTPLAGTWGTLLLDGFGAYTYAPSAAAQALDPGQTVTDTFTYTISDGRGGSATATLVISVVGANDPTTISGVFIGAVTEDAVATASGTLTNNDPDVGTRPFVAQSNSAGAYGTFSIDSSGTWTYTLTNAAANVQALAQGQSVTETFIVATDDGTTASITVTVNGANDAPVVSSTSISAVEEGAAVGLGLAVPSDIDSGSVLTITVTGLPTIGQVQLANGTAIANGATLTATQLAGLRYLPPTDYDGVAPVGTFAYSVSDGIATVNGGTTITVSAVNDPPTAFNDARTTGENSTLSTNVPTATDVDGTVSSYTLATGVGAGNGTLAFNSSGAYVFSTGTAFDNLAAGQSRSVNFTYTATDNSGAVSAPATVTITVTGANDAPTGADATYTIAEDGSRAFAGADFGFADVDAGDTLARVRIDSLPAAGALTLNGTAVTAGQLIDAADLPNLVFTPAANANGANYANFTFSVQDSGGLFDAAPNTITFNVNAVNDPPVAVVTPASGDEDTPIAVSLTGTDIDGTIASVRVTVLPANGTLFLADGTTPVVANAALTPAQAASLVFVPAADFNGSVNVTFTVTDNSGATSAPAVTPITVAPVVDPVISIDDVSVNEADGTMTFTVSLSAATTATVSVNYATGNGTATAGADYTAGSGTLTFAAGVTSQTVTVTIAEDTIAEGNETFNVTLSAPVNATLGDNLGVGTIIDNDDAPTISSVSSPTITEGSDLVYAVTLSNASVTATTFAYTLGGGTAAAADYGTPTFSNGVTLSAGVLTVPAGVTGFSITLPTTQDALDEANETVPVTVGGVSGTGTITDDDATPSLSIGDVTVNEAAGTMSFTVTLSAASGQSVSVNYATGDVTATAGADYTAGSGTLAFAPGVVSQTVTVAIAEDTLFEGSETLNVTLSGATNATIADSTGVGTITDNDAAPTIASVSSPTVTEGSDLVYAVSLSNASSSATTFAYTLGGGTAAAADYGTPSFSNGVTLSAGVLTVPAGVTGFSITLPTTPDALDEVNETVPVTVGGVSGTGTITDDDATPSLSIDDVTVNEAAGTMTFTVTLSAASGQSVSVNYGTSNGTATAGADYTAGSGTLTFAPGVVSQTITVAITEDTVFEGNETLNVTLSAATNATIADGTGIGTITDNDAAPTVSSVSSPTVVEGTNLVYTVNLSNASSSATTFAYTLGGGSAAAADYGTPTFSNGVTLSAGVLTVPAGVTSFSITLPTTQDALDEADETVPVTVGGVSGTGTITDDDATPSLSIDDVTVNEAAGTMSFTVTLSAASGQSVSVNYGTSNGTATAGADYTAGSGTLTFAPGVVSQTVTVNIAEDTIFEGDETLNVTLSAATNATIADGTGVGTITDNDTAPTISSVSSPTVSEGSDLVYAVTLSNTSATATTFAYTLGGGTAAAADYGTPSFSNGVTLSAGVLTVPAGVTGFSITLPTTQDALDKADETVPVTVGGVSGTGTITDDDATPSLSIGDVTVNEAAGTATFTVTLSAASGQAVTVGYNATNGTATAGADYTALVPGTLTFAPGVTSQTITVAITDDTVFESSETFNVNLTSPTNATIADNLGVGTITDNDAAPTIASVSSPTVTEGSDLVYAVALSNASATATTFAYTLGGGSAAAADYGTPTFSDGVTLAAGVLTVPAGVTSFSITLPTTQDALDEVNETVPVTVGGVSGTGTITDDDATPSLSIDDVTVNEAAGTMSFTVTLSAASGQSVSVNYGTSNGTATAGADYTAGSGTLTFAPGVVSQTITVAITEDTVFEGNETLNVTLSAATNATIADGTGIGTITDNDAAPTVSSVSSPTVVEGTNLVYTVNLSNASSSATTFAYTLGGGSAAAADYGTPTFSNGVTLSAGVLTVPAGVTSFSITLPTTQDALDEADETVPVTVGGVSGTGTITDDDATPSLSIDDVTVNEAAGTMSFTVTLSAASGQSVSVNYGTSNGTATAGADYTAGSGTLTFAPGVVSQTVTVNIAEDTIFEGDETLNVTLSAATNATIADGTGVGTITDNDAAPTLTVSSPTVAENGGFAVFTLGLSNPSSTATSFNLALANGTATAADYGPALEVSTDNGVTWTSATSATIAAGATSVLVRTPITSDTIDEANETFTLTATTSAGTTSNANASGTATITDDDNAPTISSVSAATAVEATSLVHTVTLSNASSVATTYSLSLTDVTATGGGVDYTSTLTNAAFSNGVTISGGTITVPAGVTSFSVTVPTSADTIAEANETYTLAVDAASGTGTINDDDAAPTVSTVSAATQIEGTTLVHTVTLTNASSSATTFAYTLGGGSATGGGTDYTTPPVFSNGVTLAGGVLSVAAGVTSFTVSVPTTLDTIDEGVSETYDLSVGGVTAVGTITDDDNAPTISSVSAASATEATSLVHTVTLSNASSVATTYSLSLTDVTATGGGVDYTSALTNAAFSNGVTISGGTITVPAGVTSFSVTVPTSADTIAEANETYTLAVGTASGTGTINDDDNAPTVSSVTAATQIEGTTLVHTVTLSNASSSVTTFAYTLGGGSATGGGTDYTTPPVFSNGVTLAGGVLSVPAGVTSFTVSVPTTLDTVDEGVSETYDLSVGGVTAIGTITDDDNAPTISSVSAATQLEGTTLVHTVTLSNASSVATTFAYTLGGGSATGGGTDYTTPPTFSNGVTLAGGVLSVPAGVTSFTISVPTTPDTIDEGASETYNLSVGGVAAVGTITDDDNAPTISSVSAATQVEGTTLVHTVTLSNASSVATTFAYTLGGGSATGGGTDYTTPPTFSNGVTLAGGVLSVPAGVTSFTVSVPTTLDTIDEGASETYDLSVGGVTAIGTITDDDNAPTISSVSAASATEATSLVHTVTLSNASSVATTYSLSLADVTATGGGVDYTSTLTNTAFSNGVTISGGVITVPAGVTSFTVAVPTSADTIAEANETYTLAVGAASGTGTINDDDNAPTISSVSAATQVEGTTLVHTVTLSNASSSVTTFAYTLGGGSATGGGTDYTTPPVFSNGVTLAGGVLTVPAGVTSFTISVPTTLDTIDEGASETYDLSVGGVTAVGTITDDDNAPTISSVSAASATEATSLVHTVTLSNASSVATTYSLSLTDVTATGGGVDYTSTLTNTAFSNGVTISGGTITVPAGVTSFSVTVPTSADTIDEANETYTLSVGTASGTGTINDDDNAPTVSTVSAATQIEGTTLVHTVTLSNASSVVTTFAYTLGGGSATGGGTDYTTPPTFSNGVTLAAGVLSVPAGVTSFTISVPTTLDTIDEGASETYDLSVGGVTAVGTITDDDNAPTISSVSAASATEATSLVHTVTLSNASSVATTYSLSLTDVTATGGGVDYTSTLTNTAFSNGVTISGGTITVPAGVTSFSVTVPTSADTIDEANETYTLSVGTASGTGTINDDDNAPTVSTVSAATQIEGTTLVHTVTLSNASSVVTTFAYTLGGGSATGGGTDYTTPPTFSNGVTLAAGVLSVPAGVTSFTISVPTTLDTIDEGASETYNLSVGGVAAVGTITDDDNAPTISSVSAATQVEGTTLVHTVTLSNASSVATTFAYTLGGGSATGGGTDYTTPPTFSNGVTLAGGILSVPAGVTSFTVSVPTTLDTIDEGTSETYDLSVGGVTAVGTITDDDNAPTISSVSAASATEATSLVHTVTLSNASSVATTYSLSLTDVTATGGGVDYTSTLTNAAFSNGVTISGSTITVPAGVTSFSVTVPSTADTIDEANETYTLTVGAASGTGTINDDDDAPKISSVSAATEIEGTTLVHTVTLSNASSSVTTFAYTLDGGSATGGGTDYTTPPTFSNGVTLAGGVLSVPAGVTLFTVSVPTTLDTIDEGASETYNLSVGGVTAVGTITDDDNAPTLSVNNLNITEDRLDGFATFTVSLSNASSTAITVGLALTNGGTGTAATGGGVDYGAAGPTNLQVSTNNGTTWTNATSATFAPGATSVLVRTPLVNDLLDEATESFTLTATHTAGSTSAAGIATVIDNDPTPTLAINDVTVNEAAGTATFTVTLSAASGQTVTVNYSMLGQTALPGSDFTAGSGTLTFAPGTTTQTINVPILNDSVYEGSETFRINLSAPVNATIADGVGIGTIADNGTGSGGTDNDTPTLAVSSITVSDQSNGFATFVVSLSNRSTTATSVSLVLANGTATGGVDYGPALEVSTDNGVTWTSATSATIAANSSYVLVRTPIIRDVVTEGSETFTLTARVTAGTTNNGMASGTGTITDTNNSPDAIDDRPTAMLQEDTPTRTTLSGNVIGGGAGNVADTDPNNDTLRVTGATAGNSLVTGGVALGSPLTVSGLYGNLVIQANGAYTYTLDNARIQTQNMIGGQVYNDVFSYRVTDGNGGYDTATITVNVTGTLDLTAITPQPVAIAADGLSGEYYGYNDVVVTGNRVHADDRTATSLGTGANLESVEDITAIINGRNVTMGGPGNIVGSNTAGAVNAADVLFNVRTLNYGTTPVVNSSLGSNSAVAAGNALPPQDNNSSSTSTALANFLDQDAATARVQTGTPTGTAVGTQTGLGTTTDAIVRMTGFVYLERGNYDFRVTGDDGFRLRVGGETLIEFDGNQPPTTRTFFNVEVNDRISGLTSIELLYWEQGGNANLQFEFRPSDSTAWVPFSLDSIAFFSTANAPTLTDTRIQDIVETNVNQQYELRTGSVLDGDANTNTLTGAEGRDYIQGFGGDDILNGNGSADYLDGGIGNDVLNGGDGNDILVGGTGNDTMTGGAGDDIYRVDGAGDVVVEVAGVGQGTDTVEIEASYNVGTYAIGNNVENALLLGSFNSNVNGNAVNNRITGNDGNNILVGGAGDDRLLGGRGNDTLTGDSGTGGNVGKDIFEWNLADRGTAGAPAIDRITDFTYSGSTTSSAVPYGDLTPQHTDVLDLRDLLSGESSTSLNTGATPNIGTLLNYIDITSVAGGDTTIRISSTGGFTGGTYAAGQEDQRIVLSGVNLFSVTGTTTETDLLQRLIANGTLVVD
jgi:VCBS repeat-containing protein